MPAADRQRRAERLERLVPEDLLPGPERSDLLRLMILLAELPAPPDPDGRLDRYPARHDRYLRAIDGDDPELVEERFLELYAHLHLHEAPYTPGERRRMDAAGGYWCHAGGLSPVVRAGRWVRPTTVSADLGAGNGLQLLLLQRLHPHPLSVQLEISSAAVEMGRQLQRWLSIPEDAVQWIVADLLEAELPDADLVYLYRPVRPTGKGAAFYRRLADHLARRDRETVVLSVADCLGSFLDASFDEVYGDGHLTCFRSG